MSSDEKFSFYRAKLCEQSKSKCFRDLALNGAIDSNGEEGGRDFSIRVISVEIG